MATTVRLKVLPRVESRGHRYVWLRNLTQAITIGILLVVPLSGLARVDLYEGDHRMLYREATLKEGLAAVIIGIAALYLVTFVINFACGRMFCGWGCPVGFLNRLADVANLKPDKRQARWKRWRDAAGPIGHSTLLTVSCMFWWTSPATYLAFDSPVALAWAWGLTLTGVASLAALGWWWRWGFCIRACPVGLYYSFVAPSQSFGIFFREATERGEGDTDACLHCNACIKVCPVDLNPMDLAEAIPARGGVSVSDAPANNHCLKCGDCIQACEMMIDLASERRGIDEVPLRFGFYDGPQRLVRRRGGGEIVKSHQILQA